MIELFAEITCDGEIEFDLYCATDPHTNCSGDRNVISQIRAEAKQAGWKRKAGFDFCPACWAQVKALSLLGDK